MQVHKEYCLTKGVFSPSHYEICTVYFTSSFFLRNCRIGTLQNHMLQSAVIQETSADTLRTICGHLTRGSWNRQEESEDLKCCNASHHFLANAI